MWCLEMIEVDQETNIVHIFKSNYLSTLLLGLYGYEYRDFKIS